MIEFFKTSEKTARLIETDNTLVAAVDKKDTKSKIKKTFEKMFNVKVKGVNIMIKDNKKYAYIKLDDKNPAIDVATKMGLI